MRYRYPNPSCSVQLSYYVALPYNVQRWTTRIHAPRYGHPTEPYCNLNTNSNPNPSNSGTSEV